MPSSAPRFDVVVFGATSFVGAIICDYLTQRLGSAGPVTWAMAGRNPSKLGAVAEKTGARVERIVADADDMEALREMARSARVVISTVGPYATYGSKLVEAVAEAGSDYVDLTGEPQWMQRMIDAHGDAAVASGARIVHACGFDSIPSDLGVLFTQDQANERFGRHCSEIRMEVRAIRGGASGGTIASGMTVAEELTRDPALRKVLGNPYALAPEGQRKGPRQKNVLRPERNVNGEWLGPFVMAGTNTKVVFRSNALLGYPWGKDFAYDESMAVGSGPAGLARAGAITGGLAAFMGAVAIPPVRGLMQRFVLPDPGEGPSPEQQQEGYFKLAFRGTTDDERTITTEVTGDRDPGYGSTARMISEAALALLGTTKTATTGGFWTPASALGTELIRTLEQHAGLTFSVAED